MVILMCWWGECWYGMGVCHMYGCFVQNSHGMVYALEVVKLQNLENLVVEQNGGVQN